MLSAQHIYNFMDRLDFEYVYMSGVLVCAAIVLPLDRVSQSGGKYFVLWLSAFLPGGRAVPLHPWEDKAMFSRGFNSQAVDASQFRNFPQEKPQRNAGRMLIRAAHWRLRNPWQNAPL
jgi:hypothetical protein